MTHVSSILVDDRRVPQNGIPEGMLLFETADEAIRYLEENDVTSVGTLFCDHDLGVDKDMQAITIMPLVTYLEERAFNDTGIHVDQVYIHTSNPRGKENIYAAFTGRFLEKYVKSVDKVSDTELGLIDRDYQKNYQSNSYQSQNELNELSTDTDDYYRL